MSRAARARAARPTRPSRGRRTAPAPGIVFAGWADHVGSLVRLWRVVRGGRAKGRRFVLNPGDLGDRVPATLGLRVGELIMEQSREEGGYLGRPRRRVSSFALYHLDRRPPPYHLKGDIEAAEIERALGQPLPEWPDLAALLNEHAPDGHLKRDTWAQRVGELSGASRRGARKRTAPPASSRPPGTRILRAL